MGWALALFAFLFPVHHAHAAPAPPTTTTTTTVSIPIPAPSPPYGCAAALAYLETHQAPGFSDECPAYAYGAQAMTCDNNAAYGCLGQQVIRIADPCPAAYENEAYNSWVLVGLVAQRGDFVLAPGAGGTDPFGSC